MTRTRVAVVGAGAFGGNHLRVISELPEAELVAVVDSDRGRAREAGARYSCEAVSSCDALAERVDAAVVAVPTSSHAEVTVSLLEAGIDVLVEKPIAADVASARRMADTAARHGRILQVGHLERFNPAVEALASRITVPLFFEIHRLNLFSPRSLDIDVVLDLMIHDIDVVLSLTGSAPEEIRAAGIAILSKNVDIANVRLAFGNGCIANLTASRVSTERVRKLRLFQPNQYISLDYQKQEAAVFTVAGGNSPGDGEREIGYDEIAPPKAEPLRLELESFLGSVVTRRPPRVTADDATRALEVSLAILDRIKEHLEIVASTLSSRR